MYVLRSASAGAQDGRRVCRRGEGSFWVLFANTAPLGCNCRRKLCETATNDATTAATAATAATVIPTAIQKPRGVAPKLGGVDDTT
jgi:hypothetical protein